MVPDRRPLPHRDNRGVTLIELLVVVALIAVVLVLAAPSFQGMIEMQRLRGTNAQLVTDLQFARAEAVSRGALLRVSFRSNADMTCYSLYTSLSNATRCNCLNGAGTACSGSMVEVRTVQVPTSRGAKVEIAPGQDVSAIAFDPVTGGLFKIPTDDFSAPLEDFRVWTSIDTPRRLETRLNRAGRPTVCRPAGSTMTEGAC